MCGTRLICGILISGEERAMQTEGNYGAGENLAVEALLAEGSLRSMARPLRTEMERLPSLEPQGDSAIRGFLLAIPLSFSLWAMIGLLVWAAMR